MRSKRLIKHIIHRLRFARLRFGIIDNAQQSHDTRSINIGFDKLENLLLHLLSYGRFVVRRYTSLLAKTAHTDTVVEGNITCRVP